MCNALGHWHNSCSRPSIPTHPNRRQCCSLSVWCHSARGSIWYHWTRGSIWFHRARDSLHFQFFFSVKSWDLNLFKATSLNISSISVLHSGITLTEFYHNTPSCITLSGITRLRLVSQHSFWYHHTSSCILCFCLVFKHPILFYMTVLYHYIVSQHSVWYHQRLYLVSPKTLSVITTLCLVSRRLCLVSMSILSGITKDFLVSQKNGLLYQKTLSVILGNSRTACLILLHRHSCISSLQPYLFLLPLTLECALCSNSTWTVECLYSRRVE